MGCAALCKTAIRPQSKIADFEYFVWNKSSQKCWCNKDYDTKIEKADFTSGMVGCQTNDEIVTSGTTTTITTTSTTTTIATSTNCELLVNAKYTSDKNLNKDIETNEIDWQACEAHCETAYSAAKFFVWWEKSNGQCVCKSHKGSIKNVTTGVTSGMVGCHNRRKRGLKERDDSGKLGDNLALAEANPDLSHDQPKGNKKTPNHAVDNKSNNGKANAAGISRFM